MATKPEIHRDARGKPLPPEPPPKQPREVKTSMPSPKSKPARR